VVSCCLLFARVFLDVEHLCLMTAGALPVIAADIVLSNDEDDTDYAHLLGQTDPSMGHVHVVDDAENVGKTLAEANNPGLIGAGTPGSTSPPVTDRAPTAPTSGARGWKCPRIAIKRSDQGCCVAQVITHIKLPPYRMS
jgi:hypothetical protein